MKQISIALNVILIAALFVFSCSQFSKINQPPLPTYPPCPDCSKTTFQGISAAIAYRLADNYNNEMHTNDDSRCVWFSLDTIKAFICAIEKVDSFNCKRKFKLGIRFYYGRYPKKTPESDFPGLDPRYAGKHTLFLVPTYDNDTTNEDFDLNTLTQAMNDSCKPQSFFSLGKDTKPGSILGGFSVPPSPPPNDQARNHGDLIPPKGASGARFLYP